MQIPELWEITTASNQAEFKYSCSLLGLRGNHKVQHKYSSPLIEF